MTKKIGTLLLVITLCFSIFTACNNKQNETSPSPSAITEATETPSPTEPPQTSAVKNPDIILATTTSTQDSGLLDVLIPMFEETSGYTVKTIAVGTGAALEMGQQGNADVLMTHAPASEQPLVDAGYVIDYTLLMHNDFVVVGPSEDPAGIKGSATAKDAFSKIYDTKSLFVSRGDDSGTHKKELQLWDSAGITPEWENYQETGAGMGDSLNVAAEKGGYILTDRATYLSLQDNLAGLEILFEGDEDLYNIYHVMAVNPEMFSQANYEGATAFISFLTSAETQEVIGSYGVDKFGQPLFFPDAT